jgi:hypothetical protein
LRDRHFPQLDDGFVFGYNDYVEQIINFVHEYEITIPILIAGQSREKKKMRCCNSLQTYIFGNCVLKFKCNGHTTWLYFRLLQ